MRSTWPGARSCASWAAARASTSFKAARSPAVCGLWALEQLPVEVASARRGKGMFNYQAWFADPASYWINRWNARGASRESVVRRYDAAMGAVLATLDIVADGDWELGANFYGHGLYTIEQRWRQSTDRTPLICSVVARTYERVDLSH